MVDQQTTTIGCLPLARPSRSLLRLLLIVAVAFTASDALAHRSGCHRWHSCPSDHGTYVCGDLGHCSGCPDNQYCLAGQAKLAQSEPRGSKPESQQRPGVPAKDAWTCPSDAPIKGQLHDLLRRAVHLSPARWTVLRQDQTRTVLRDGRRGKAGRVPSVEAVNVGSSSRIRLVTLTALNVRLYRPCMWQHPWLRIELAVRAVLADRLTRGPSAKIDRVLMARVKEREQIERAGWFN